MSKLSSGPSIKIYNLVSNWIIFDNNKVKILSNQIIKISFGIKVNCILDLKKMQIQTVDLNVKNIIAIKEKYVCEKFSIVHDRKNNTRIKFPLCTIKKIRPK